MDRKQARPFFLFLIIFLFLITQISIAAENTKSEVFAPFVSRLEVSADTEKITLQWKNPSDINNYKRIYRHNTEITEQNFSQARQIASVEPQVEAYIDTPPSSSQEFYYAVLLEDKNGSPYKVFIAYRNKTTSGIKLVASQTKPSSFTQITKIKASVQNNSVVITFNVSDKSRELYLYRSLVPLISLADLNAVPFRQKLSPGSELITDYPVAGVDYYYAVIDAEEATSPALKLIADQNTTVQPVRIPLTALLKSEGPALRPSPLPAPYILYDITTGSELLPPLPFMLPPLVALNNQTEEEINGLLKRLELPNTKVEVELLAMEEAANTTGEDKTLKTIVQETLSKADYRTTTERLAAMLQEKIKPATKARVHFYLGQSYFFRQEYQKAVMHFILAQDLLYNESQRWLELCFNHLYEQK